jgi:hypothetical protein
VAPLMNIRRTAHGSFERGEKLEIEGLFVWFRRHLQRDNRHPPHTDIVLETIRLAYLNHPLLYSRAVFRLSMLDRAEEEAIRGVRDGLRFLQFGRIFAEQLLHLEIL